jgi:hypothetical protein
MLEPQSPLKSVCHSCPGPLKWGTLMKAGRIQRTNWLQCINTPKSLFQSQNLIWSWLRGVTRRPMFDLLTLKAPITISRIMSIVSINFSQILISKRNHSICTEVYKPHQNFLQGYLFSCFWTTEVEKLASRMRSWYIGLSRTQNYNVLTVRKPWAITKPW